MASSSPATEGKPVDGGDHRFAELLDGRKNGTDGLEKNLDLFGAHAGTLFQIGTRAKGFFARSADYDHPCLGVLCNFFEAVTEFLQQLPADGIHRLRPVQHEGGDAVFYLA